MPLDLLEPTSYHPGAGIDNARGPPRPSSGMMASLPSGDSQRLRAPPTPSDSQPPTPLCPGPLQLAGSRAPEMAEPNEPPKPPPAGDELPSDKWHQIRQVGAGLLSFAAGLYDAWVQGRNSGFDISFDTVLILTGLYLISGAEGLLPEKFKRPPPTGPAP